MRRAGRFTTELLRIARVLHLLDVNEVCLDICRERFKWYKHIQYRLNDGRDCSMLPDNFFELVASYDSLVHVEPEIIRGYLEGLLPKMKPRCLLWLDHAGTGESNKGHRTAMTAELMQQFARELGLTFVTQIYRNPDDCISILQFPGRTL